MRLTRHCVVECEVESVLSRTAGRHTVVLSHVTVRCVGDKEGAVVQLLQALSQPQQPPLLVPADLGVGVANGVAGEEEGVTRGEGDEKGRGENDWRDW